jgi:hypothetical protein
MCNDNIIPMTRNATVLPGCGGWKRNLKSDVLKIKLGAYDSDN